MRGSFDEDDSEVSPRSVDTKWHNPVVGSPISSISSSEDTDKTFDSGFSLFTSMVPFGPNAIPQGARSARKNRSTSHVVTGRPRSISVDQYWMNPAYRRRGSNRTSGPGSGGASGGGSIDGSPKKRSLRRANKREQASRTLFVRNITTHVPNEEIKERFQEFGEVRTIYTNCKHRGFVMVSYFDLRDAQKALGEMQGAMMYGKHLDVHNSIPKLNDINYATLVLPVILPTAVISNLFSPFGELRQIRDGKFVEYYDSRDAEKAFDALNGKEVDGIVLNLEHARFIASPKANDSQTHLEVVGEKKSVSTNNIQNFGGSGAARSNDKNSRSDVLDQDRKSSGGNGKKYVSNDNNEKGKKKGDKQKPDRKNNANKKRLDKRKFTVDLEKIRRGEEKKTTIMIRNIPNKYTQKMLLETIDTALKRKYDFLYLPIDFKNNCNVGYAFINFIDPRSIIDLSEAFAGKKWHQFNSEKKCALSFGRIQGKWNLISHFKNSSLMAEDESCRPLVFQSSGPKVGEREEFPK